MPETRKPDEQDARRRPYEPPTVILLGTLAEMTAGIVPTSVDTVLPGSLN